jgi:hypothetical protein
MMEVIRSSETSFLTTATQCHSSEDALFIVTVVKPSNLATIYRNVKQSEEIRNRYDKGEMECRSSTSVHMEQAVAAAEDKCATFGGRDWSLKGHSMENLFVMTSFSIKCS